MRGYYNEYTELSRKIIKIILIFIVAPLIVITMIALLVLKEIEGFFIVLGCYVTIFGAVFLDSIIIRAIMRDKVNEEIERSESSEIAQIELDNDEVHCPYCNSAIKKGATTCPFCKARYINIK
jgi:hypothetical protein